MQLRQSNRLLPVLGIVLFSIFVLVAQRACTDKGSDSVMLESVPQLASPDADTPADTITTLTANVAAMTRELKRLEDDNSALKRDNAALLKQRGRLVDEMSARMDKELAAIDSRSSDNDNAQLTALQRQLDALSERLAQGTSPADASALPVGFGFDDATATEEIVWIEPLDAVSNNASLPGLPQSDATGQRQQAKTLTQPHFTVPRNATLLGSTAMTAMLGRVPIRGEVRDPMPFKVLTGTDNLAANGYRVPGVAGMVWTGMAIGDWTLSCVRGELHSVTFVFADGSIQTLSSDEAQGGQGGRRRALGWISDARGVPCVSGTRQSNAAQYLGQRILAASVEAAADAAAAAQTSTVIGDVGITTSVDGELGSYLLGRSAADGSAEVAAWLAERQAQSFDAVFVPAGAELVIHVDRELPIDLDPTARKLHYAADTAHTSDRSGP